MAKSTIKKTTPVENPVVTRTVKGKEVIEKTDNPGADTEEKRAQKEKERENANIKATQETAANNEVPADGDGVE